MKCIEPTCFHYECQSCGHDICPERHVSPGEPETCAACFELETALRHAINTSTDTTDYSWSAA